GFTSTDANPTVSPGANIIYVLAETINTTGCSDINPVAITVNPLPNAGWSVTNVNKRYTFTVKDSSFSASSYHWDFGDGATATGYNETHVFPKNTTFQVKLKVTNSFGCTSELDAGINIISSPAGNVCPGQQFVVVVIESFGRQTLKSAKINWAINGAAQTPYSWSGSLDSGKKDTVIL